MKKSFWAKLFFSYLAVLAFALAIGMNLYRSSLLRIRQSTERYSRYSLLQVNESISQMKQTIQALADTLSVREECISLIYAEQELTSYKREAIGRLQKEMKRQVAHNQYVSGIYIWFEHPQLAASTARGMIKGREDMEKMLNEEFGITMEQMREWLKESGEVSLHLLGTGEFAGKAIAVIRGSRSYAEETPVIMMELRIGTWLSILTGGKQETVDHDAMFWLVSDDGPLYLAPGNTRGLAAYAGKTGSPTEGKTERLRYEGEDLILMGMERDDHLRLMSAWNYDSYTKTQKQYQWTAVLFLSAYLSMGAVVAAVLTKINYGPVQRLLNLLMERVNAVSGNEFAILEMGINSLLKYSQDYEETKAKEQARLREKAIISLLLGEVEKEEFPRLCEEYNLRFSSDRFLAAGIAIKDIGRLFCEEKGLQKKRETQEVGLFAVNSVAEELLGQRGSVFTCQQEGKIWAIVSPPCGEDEGFHGNIMETCRKAEGFLREEMGIAVRVFVGELFQETEKLSGIALAYQSVKWGMEQIESYNIPVAVNDYQSVKACVSPAAGLPRDDAEIMRRRLFSAVAAGDFDEADSLYLKLRRQDTEYSDISFATVRAQSLILAGYFVSCLPDEARSKHREEINDYLETIRSERKDERLIGLMHDWMVYFHGINPESEEKHARQDGSNAAEEAVSYINGHYSDINLSVAQVAEKLSVSASYLTRAFQKKYGMSVLQYIHCRRIDMAIVLLRESGSTIEMIAEEVGYANSLALIRAFKRHKNCTPTEYRNSLKEGQVIL